MLPALRIMAGSSSPTVIYLSGTPGSPNLAEDENDDPANALASWTFNVDGTIDRDITAGESQWVTSPAEWNLGQVNPARDFWLRFTTQSGDDPTSSTGTLGVTWNPLSGAGEAECKVSWSQTEVGELDGVMKVEIALDDAGVTIIATGYYRGVAHVDA